MAMLPGSWSSTINLSGHDCVTHTLQDSKVDWIKKEEAVNSFTISVQITNDRLGASLLLSVAQNRAQFSSTSRPVTQLYIPRISR